MTISAIAPVTWQPAKHKSCSLIVLSRTFLIIKINAPSYQSRMSFGNAGASASLEREVKTLGGRCATAIRTPTRAPFKVTTRNFPTLKPAPNGTSPSSSPARRNSRNFDTCTPATPPARRNSRKTDDVSIFPRSHLRLVLVNNPHLPSPPDGIPGILPRAHLHPSPPPPARRNSKKTDDVSIFPRSHLGDLEVMT